MYKLLECSFDYADEFNIYSFSIMSDESWERTKAYIKKKFIPGQRFGFGTNEDLTFENIDAIFKRIKVTDITKDQFDVIKYTIGNDFGTFTLDDLVIKLYEMNDEYDEEEEKEVENLRSE